MIQLHSNRVSFSFLQTGDIFKISAEPILINQLLTNELDGSLNNIYLRIHDGSKTKAYPLLGLRSNSEIHYSDKQIQWNGTVENIRYKVVFTLTENDVWFWDIFLEGSGETVDLIYGQDLGLADQGGVQSNEAYMSQYIDHKVFEDKQQGYIVCSRQNMDQSTGNPYIQQGSLGRIVGYSTDGFQFFGKSYKETNQPEALFQDKLANQIYQYEFAYIALQTEKVQLNGNASFTFYGIYKDHHPETVQQVEFLDEVKAARVMVTFEEQALKSVDRVQLAPNFGEPLKTLPMSKEEIEKLFPERHEEEYVDGKLLSFFTDTHEHVVLKDKELLVERPHGHILMSGNNHHRTNHVITSTSYMYGVFNSQLTVGNTSHNKFLSNIRNPLNVMKTSGQRLYIEIDGVYHLLTMPSLFEIGFNYARWYYKTEDDVITVTNVTYTKSSQLRLYVQSAKNRKYRFILTNQVIMHEKEYELPYHFEENDGVLIFKADEKALNAKTYPNLRFRMKISGPEYKVQDEKVFFEQKPARSFGLNVIEVEPASEWSVLIQGILDGEELPVEENDIETEIEKYRAYFKEVMNGFRLTGTREPEKLKKVNALVWWYTHNMLVHYSVPHGLEQYTGAAWGTRDVCQGPSEYFMATHHYESAREIIKIVYSHQYVEDGNWPQWFMFDKYHHLQQLESHGDIIVWPLKVVSDYLLTTGDYSILEEKVPFTRQTDFDFTEETYTIFEHIEKEIEYIKEHFLHDTYLSSYGDGDWDDTLQPANKQLKQFMVSSWTVALTYQAVKQYGEALMKFKPEKGQELLQLADSIKADFQKYMLSSDVLPGFLYMEDPDKPEWMLHPTDTKTGIHYRLIPMTQSIISELFDTEQAQRHFEIIKEHLYFPDGVRLMNKPAHYTGGKSVHFKRAEQAANFGREIGLNYIHAHIRFVEAMAKLGNAEEAWKGLETINPIGLQKVVPNAEFRQSNAYFSSSDGKFNDRYHAQENFDKLRTGEVAVKGGWRIYSSGPGIYINQLITNLLGVRQAQDSLVIDPVLSQEFDGLEFHFNLENKPVTFVYKVKGTVVDGLTVNGQSVDFERIHNPYRSTGIRVQIEEIQKYLREGNENRIEIHLQ